MLSTQDDLTERDLALFRSCEHIAIDTEMTGLDPYLDQLCTVQISGKAGEPVVIKTTEWREAPNLQRILVDRSVTKVFHFAVMDCSFLLRNIGVETTNVFCTKIASRIVRRNAESHSLSVILEDVLDITLDKTLQRSNWCKDSLSQQELEYAANDVRWLVDLKTELEKRLIDLGQLETGLSYVELNRRCQSCIPTLVQLWLNGWDFGKDTGTSVFSY